MKLKEVRDPKKIARDWETNPRWSGITREYTPEDVLRLRGSIDVEPRPTATPPPATSARSAPAISTK